MPNAEYRNYVRRYRCRDLGQGVEEGDYYRTPLDRPDWTGKRPYATPAGTVVYLFDDELDAEAAPESVPMYIVMDDYEADGTESPPYPANGTRLAEHWPATEVGVIAMLETPVTKEDGRSEWKWFRLANGDLIFGCFPQGDLYFEVEEDGLPPQPPVTP